MNKPPKARSHATKKGHRSIWGKTSVALRRLRICRRGDRTDAYNTLERMKNTDIPAETSEGDRRLLYQIAISNLVFLKNVQWNLIYYSILIYGAAIAIFRISSGLRFYAIVLTFITFIVSIVFAFDLQNKMRHERIMIAKKSFSFPCS